MCSCILQILFIFFFNIHIDCAEHVINTVYIDLGFDILDHNGKQNVMLSTSTCSLPGMMALKLVSIGALRNCQLIC